MKTPFPVLILMLSSTLGWADGALDTTFGTAGRTLVAFDAGSSNEDLAFGSALQSDGKLIVVGNASNANGDMDFAVARLLPNGALDPSFGANGKAMYGFDYGAGNNDTAFAVTVTSDGTIVIMGSVEYPAAPYATQLLALHPDGTVAATAAPRVGTAGVDVKITANGTITLVGYNNGSIEVDQFSNLLVLQKSTLLSASPVAGTISSPSSLAPRPDGKITIAGVAQIPADPPEYDCFVLQLNSDLSLDTGFGTNQTGIYSFSDGGCSSLALQSDGKILLVAQAGAVNYPAVLFRILADGSGFDTSFGSTSPKAGYSFWCYEQCPTYDQNENYAWSVAQQSDGKIVVAGYGSVADPARGPYDFGIARFTADGSPDDAFVGDYANASPGSVLVGFEPYNGSAIGQDDEAYSMVIDSLDRIYVIGTQYNEGDYNMAIARLAGDKVFVDGFESRP